jgi:hypothetical protein
MDLCHGNRNDADAEKQEDERAVEPDCSVGSLPEHTILSHDDGSKGIPGP